MITVKTDLRSYISIEGHAGYAPAGSDIVCAAVSILYETLKELLKGKAEFAEQNGRVRVILDPDQIGEAEEHYLKFFMTGIRGIEEAYPKNLKLKIRRA